MLTLFDMHATSRQLAVRHCDQNGQGWIELRTLAGQRLGEIPNEYLPLMPHWSPDGARVAFFGNQGRLYVHRLGEVLPQLIYDDPALNAGFCEWSPEGTHLVFSAYGRADGTLPSIYRLDVRTGETVQLTNTPRRADLFPHWSPSGQWVAFQRQDLDEPEIPPRIYVLDPQTNECFPILHTAGGYCHTGRHAWRADSSALLVTHGHSEGVELRAIRLADRVTTWQYTSPTLKTGVFLPGGEGLIAVCSDALLWFDYPSGRLRQRLSLAALAPVQVYYSGPQVGFDQDPAVVYFLGENSSLYRWTLGGDCVCVLDEPPQPKPAFAHEAYTVLSRDGRPVPVRRFSPPEPKRPAILYVQGGPGLEINPDDPFMLRLLAEGFEVVCAAYRGSSGYGKEHDDANRGEYGRADVWDVLAAGLDWKDRLGPDRPLILAGYSYGGFLTLLALAQEGQPFAGGITLWAVSGLHRMGAHQHKAWPAGEAERAAALLERSPLEQAGRIHVPLMIFHGALDTAATTEEMQAIRDRVVAAGGNCELIVYDDDAHGLMRHRDEIHTRVLDFVERL